MVKGRKIRKADWDKVSELVTSIFDERKDSTFRKEHENKWEEIDRQIAMNPMRRLTEGGKELPKSWHSVIELGELSKASEIITSDVMRIVFPADKSWFQPHVELKWPVDEKTGKPQMNSEKQKVADGLLRSLMVQQHQDFGLKARIRLSVKEALHHGSFGAEVRFEKEMMAKEGGKIKLVGAPVWVPYSMWNTYPDPAPSVIGTNMFYTGAMIFVDYIPLSKLKRMAQGDGWMSERLEKVEEEEHQVKSGKTKDIEIVKYYGDISIDRSDGDIYLPNAKVLLANKEIVFYKANDLPYPPVIYGGYERQDVRDPYYTSPIIKQSPIQKAASVTLNKFLDASALIVEPPIEYDGNDPDYVLNDGPTIAPGAKTPTKSMGKGMTVLDIGEPAWALKGLEMFLRQEQEGTGVSALRSGTTNSDRQTAFEVNKVAQGAEIRTIEFNSQLEPNLRTFLYMQHELNRMYMEDYEFYNDEMHTPDFVRAKKSDIQANAFFEVVGSRGLLGEEQRTERTTQVTAFASGNPLFAPLLKPDQVLLDMYRDAGKKNPEEWVKTAGAQNPQDAALKMQLQQMQQLLQQFARENESLKKDHEAKMAKISADSQTAAADRQAETQRFAAQLQEQRREFDKEMQIRLAELKSQLTQEWMQNLASMSAGGEIGKSAKQLSETAGKQSEALEKAAAVISQAAENMAKQQAESQKPRKRKVTRTATGYEVE